MTTKAYSYIRISSKNQIKGGGVLRQLEATRAYAAEHGLVLDEELSDVGKSGFHGKHVAGGALGGFLEVVKSGRIPKGSVLIVESLDRLSRERVLTAQAQLISILAAGIDVVTLIDRQRYSPDNDFTQLIVSLTIMSRAHEESKTKSERAKAAVMKRRKDALSGKPGTYILNAPKWISQTRQADGTFEISLNEKAEVVKRIFDLYDGGLGVNSILRQFNQEGVPTLRDDGNSWFDTAVTGVLRNEAAIGTLKIGNQTVENFLPSVVSREQFYRVQDISTRNRNKGRVGTTGENYTNLFTGYGVCHHCGRGIRCKRGGKTGQYLYYVCQSKFLGVECDAPKARSTVRAEAIEKAILDNVLIYSLDPDASQGRSRESLERALTECEAKAREIEGRVANTRAAIELAKGDDIMWFMTRLDELRKESGALNAETDSLRSQLREINEVRNNFTSINEEIAKEIARWPTLSTPDLFASRAKVGLSFRKLVTQIRIDIPRQEAIVMLGGLTKWWVIGVDGKVKTEADWSGLPLDILLARSKEFFGDKINDKSLREVYDALETPKNDPALWDGERKARGLPLAS